MRTAFAAGLLACLACGDGGGPNAVGTLERDRIELTAEANEPIVSVHVREGDVVEAGAVLLELDERRMRAGVDRARAARDQAAARLAELVRGPRAERIEEARARLSGAESAMRTTRRELERVEKLKTNDYASEQRLDDLRREHTEAVARRAETRAALDALLHGTTVEELDQARSALAAAEADLTDAEVRRERLTVRASRPGRIDALPFELGERPPAGAVVVVLLAEGTPYARVYVPAEVRARVREGTRAWVSVDGIEGELEGRVRTVSRDAAFTPYYALTERDRGRLTYVAEIDLAGATAQELPSGLPLEARFEPTEIATKQSGGDER